LGAGGQGVPEEARGEGIGGSNNYISQLHSTKQRSSGYKAKHQQSSVDYQPTCLGNTDKSWLIDFSVQKGAEGGIVYEAAVTIFAKNPDESGVCGDPQMLESIQDGFMRKDKRSVYELSAKDILFTPQQMHDLCTACGMVEHNGICGDDHQKYKDLSEKVCAHNKFSANTAKNACKDLKGAWKDVCEIEKCVTNGGEAALMHVEMELEKYFEENPTHRPNEPGSGCCSWDKGPKKYCGETTDYCKKGEKECQRCKGQWGVFLPENSWKR
jgi:hypothetical protein